jgi:hypothetical protein
MDGSRLRKDSGFCALNSIRLHLNIHLRNDSTKSDRKRRVLFARVVHDQGIGQPIFLSIIALSTFGALVHLV